MISRNCFPFLNINPTAVIIWGTLLCISSCGSINGEEQLLPSSPAKDTTGVIVNLDIAALTGITGDLSITTDSLTGASTLIVASQDATADYDLEIVTSGRYGIEIVAEALDSVAHLWIEDYRENPDQRTYNITGTIAITDQQAHKSAIDGSPLAAGNHPIRLHISGPLSIKEIKLVLLRPHIPSPVSLFQIMDGQTLELVWSDEFETTQIDTNKWTFDIGNWGWGNNELQYYTENLFENARQAGGNLIIEARRDSLTDLWTSARLTTRGKVDFTYGRIEFKAKVPAQRGNWSAGWLLGDSYVDERSWPYCGEIDVLETVGYQIDDRTGNGKAHASVHCEAYYFKIGNQRTASIEMERMNRDFHTYAIDWYPDSISASIDGNPYFSYANDGSKGAWPFDEPQNIILNLAMGGGWGGSEGLDPAIYSQELIVDYVRVYQRK